MEMNIVNKPDIVIATSIAPFEIEKQQLAIQTWLELGFSVVSLNIRDEIDKIQSSFQGVTFHEVKRDARKKYGKPLVYVNDILQYLQGCEAEVCGIVNSDIHLRADKDFVSYIYQQTKGSTLFASRIDIDSVESVDGEMYGYGFDMFFFDRDLLQHFPVCDDFCLGIPWWDYWVPCIALKKELHPKYLQDTVAYHVQHPINYSLKNWREVGIIFTEFFRPEIVHVLQDLLNNDQIEDLDRQLGPDITYNFILEFYQRAELLNYHELTLDDDNWTSVTEELALEEESSVNHIASVNFHPQAASESQESRELTNSKYDSLIRLAWQHYQNSQFDKMAQSLQSSFDYTINYPRTQIISDWIERFTQFSQNEGLSFDAYSLSCNPAWQQLVEAILLL